MIISTYLAKNNVLLDALYDHKNLLDVFFASFVMV